MALRDKLIERVTPLLEAGETVQEVVPALGGMSPWASAMIFGAMGRLFFNHPRLIAITDRSIVVFQADTNGFKPKSLLARLPRDTELGPFKGIWARIELDGEKLYVNKRFYKTIPQTSPAPA